MLLHSLQLYFWTGCPLTINVGLWKTMKIAPKNTTKCNICCTISVALIYVTPVKSKETKWQSVKFLECGFGNNAMNMMQWPDRWCNETRAPMGPPTV